MLEGLHAALLALLGVVGTLIEMVRRRLVRIEDKLDKLIDDSNN